MGLAVAASLIAQAMFTSTIIVFALSLKLFWVIPVIKRNYYHLPDKEPCYKKLHIFFNNNNNGHDYTTNMTPKACILIIIIFYIFLKSRIPSKLESQSLHHMLIIWKYRIRTLSEFHHLQLQLSPTFKKPHFSKQRPLCFISHMSTHFAN